MYAVTLGQALQIMSYEACGSTESEKRGHDVSSFKSWHHHNTDKLCGP